MSKEKFYTLYNIKQYHADYNIIYGERSNGKTTAVLREGLEDHINSNYKNQLAIIRRWDDEIKGAKAKEVFDGILALGWIKELTKGKYNSVFYYAQKVYLCFYDSEGVKLYQEDEPFAQFFSISGEEHYKSLSFPYITTILFDEFITRTYYLPEEFVRFQNLLSTIIRLRDNVVIYMCGNTLNKYCPYFAEMGLTNVKKQDKGTIDIYTYGESTLKVAVEYSDFPAKHKASNKYFAFNNPKLEMIKNGGWEIDIYPHLPMKYVPKDVKYQFFVEFDGELLHGNVIHKENTVFIYIHRKTTPVKDETEWLVYKQTPDHRRNYRTNILRPFSKPDAIIKEIIDREKVFFQDNEVGDLFDNYLKWCTQN